MYLWPGYGDNLRVLSWVIDRCTGRVPAAETPIGLVPRADDLNLQGLAIDRATIDQLLEVDRTAWKAEIDDIGRYLDEFGGRLPGELRDQQRRIKGALS
jgi:phosphoenolpyruvate carboxykinase (GTP)